MPVMHTAILYTSNTADQAVNTVRVQLGAARHLTRPLTCPRLSLPTNRYYGTHSMKTKNKLMLLLLYSVCMQPLELLHKSSCAIEYCGKQNL